MIIFCHLYKRFGISQNDTLKKLTKHFIMGMSFHKGVNMFNEQEMSFLFLMAPETSIK